MIKNLFLPHIKIKKNGTEMNAKVSIIMGSIND